MTRIVVYAHRYKPPPKQKPKKLAAAVEVPTIVTTEKLGGSQKTPVVAVSISRKRARLIAAARESERFAEPGAPADDAATARAMEAIARTLGMKPPKGT
jgi:hypothetical protein